MTSEEPVPRAAAASVDTSYPTARQMNRLWDATDQQEGASSLFWNHGGPLYVLWEQI